MITSTSSSSSVTGGNQGNPTTKHAQTNQGEVQVTNQASSVSNHANTQSTPDHSHELLESSGAVLSSATGSIVSMVMGSIMAFYYFI
ncbi:hypothetical protein HMI54_015000 [Coelomomyces lativittatus]|nr:hypothetical protein HMI54_015000 [Coelomomyces lativittatus]